MLYYLFIGAVFGMILGFIFGCKVGRSQVRQVGSLILDYSDSDFEEPLMFLEITPENRFFRDGERVSMQVKFGTPK